MASFAAPQNHSQPHRKSFATGHHAAFPTFGPTIPSSNPRARAPHLMNVPYSAKWRPVDLNANPYGFLKGKTAGPSHMEIPKPASQRNSVFHTRKMHGDWKQL